MKLNLWIFLTVGIIILVFIYLRKKDKLELATGIIEPDYPPVTTFPPEIELWVENGIKDLPDTLPGTDIPVGKRPRPGNGITGYIPHIDDPIWLREYYGLGGEEAFKERVAGLSPFARRIVEGFKWF